jgi:glycine cleavage system aminomethyltransferase T
VIGLGYVHRDHTEPGTRLTVAADAPMAATVASRPLVAAPARAASTGRA